MINRFVNLVLVLLVLNINLWAQKSLIYTTSDQDFTKAMELFEKQKYADARYFFDKVSQKPSNSNTLLKATADYYSGVCALELFNPDAEYLLINFINTNPGNNKVNDATFQLGKFHYNGKRYKSAIEWYTKVDISGITEDQLSEYRFNLGYSYFITKDYDNARTQFYEIKDKDTKYTAAALYYYSHIAYEQKNYETALEGFLRLRDDETFSSIVPYYITHIYFLQKKYKMVIEYAPPLLDSVIEKRVGEMARIIGESYYKLGQFNESLPYFEKYVLNTGSITIDDKYEIAYAYYKSDDLENAIKYFEPVANGDNALAQNALYHLADCYLRTKNKQKARLAFSSAANMNYNADIKENSLFNYAIVTYELSMMPFNEAIKAFNEYLTLYPYSKRADEAYQYLVLAYMNTQNYKAALESLDKIKTKDATIQKAYQRIAFYRGLELYTNLNFDDAIVLFDKSLEYSQYDKLLTIRCYYWKAESYYRLGTYNEALRLYQQFLNNPSSNLCDEIKLVNYNIGYCKFNLRNYDEALNFFQKYIDQNKNSRLSTLGDAYNRTGDCNFMKPAYWIAIDNYEKAINLATSNVDYALFQKGFALGLVNRQEKKIAILNQLLSEYPNSSYTDDALFEIGRAQVAMSDPEKAKATFTKILNQYPKSLYVPKSLLQLGLLNFNQDKDQEAIKYYKQIIENYPGTDEARNAILGMKTVYVQMNDVDTYFSYMQNIGTNVDVRFTEQDSLTYAAAENVYMSGNCERSTQQFQKYLDKYPKGSFIINANFYIGDCNMRNKNFTEAQLRYENVVNAPKSMFTEQALSALSDIYFNNKDYTKALDYYKRLETEGEIKGNITDAQIGQMRCYYYTNDFTNTVSASRNVLQIPDLPQEIKREAHYLCGKSLIELNNSTDAIKEFSLLSKDLKSKEGAEGKYLLSKLYFDTGKKDLAEKEIFDFVQKGTPHSFWLGKSFLLLSDIYVDKKDDFQAAQTLQSIIDYYEVPNDGIIEDAKSKKTVITARSAGSQDKNEQDIEINLNKQKLQ